ncbi:coiled-coil domain-containing protein 57 isoform X2 [Thunnus thynnus]|uniref:coiled-coil domain-containing protein 57 isoform X2 n=1 Tax=Thunnus thynnus TaxID=8237 RepID=UPI00352788AF
MQSEWDRGLGGLEAEVANKEREWKELQTIRVHELESALKKAKEECLSLRKHYQQLREAFQFNLTILDERDRELERYDVITDRALTVEHNSSSEIQKQMEEYERMKWDLQRRIQELEGQLTLQRQEMTAAFESELRQQEHEFNLKMDEMRAVVLSYDLKMKLLSKETEIHRQALFQATEALKTSKEFCQKIQTQLQHKDWMIKDLTAVKDYRIKELEEKVEWMETKLKKEEDDCIKKYDNVVQALKECDGQMMAQHQAHTEQLQRAEKHIVKLQEDMEVLSAQAHSVQKDQQEAMGQKDDKIQRYKQQLSTGLKRERALEQLQVQVELEWQRRCEELKSVHYLANEQLIQDMTKARDQGLRPKVDYLALEEIHCLQEQNSILRAVVTQMRKDMESLCHLLPHPQAKPQTSSPQPVQHPGFPLAISVTPAADTQMATGPPAQSTDISSKSSPAVPDYTQALEQEVSLLKARCRHLEGQLESATRLSSLAQATDKPAEGLAPIIPDSTHPQNQGLKQGSLFLEKCANMTALRKQEVRVARMESDPTNIMEQNVLVQQLQEANRYLWQQQLALGLMSGGSSENIQRTRSNPPLLHTRLKQAASYIAHLSREKQQLIEMGNCLRAQITTAGLQEPVEPEKDSSTEKQGDQHDQLSALEQLQYQLTTQELQYTLRQRACTVAEQLLPGTNSQSLLTKGATNLWSQGHKTTDRPERTDNTSPISQSQSSLDMRLQPHSPLTRFQLPSEESLQPLKELWEILDHGLSPSIYSEGEGERSSGEVAEPGGAGVQMTVYGISAPIQSHPPAEVQQRRNPSKTPFNTTKTSRPGAPNRISKIRNYNVKE